MYLYDGQVFLHYLQPSVLSKLKTKEEQEGEEIGRERRNIDLQGRKKIEQRVMGEGVEGRVEGTGEAEGRRKGKRKKSLERKKRKGRSYGWRVWGKGVRSIRGGKNMRGITQEGRKKEEFRGKEKEREM